METNSIKLGVVIVTYNRLALLKECVLACFNQIVPFKTIIIIDNNSTDGTKEYLETIKQKVIVKQLNENIGGAGGFYIGTKIAEKYDIDYLLYIDDDAIIDRHFNKAILSEINKKPDNIVAFSGTVKTKGAIQLNHRRYTDTHFNQKNSEESDYDLSFFDYDLSTFCGLFIPTKMIKKIGLPNKDFFIWLDDTEYSLRLNRYGKIRNVNAAWLDHRTKLSSDMGFSWKTYYGFRNQIYILKHYYSKRVLKKYIRKVKLIGISRRILSIFFKHNYYKTASTICFDAINDGLLDKMGKNSKYTPAFKLIK